MTHGYDSHSKNTTKITRKTDKFKFAGYHVNRPSVTSSTSADSLTRPEFADVLDVNYIVKQYQNLNIPIYSGIDKAQYGIDVPKDDFVAFAKAQQEAQSNFYQLPSALRLTFNNDLSAFQKFLSEASDDDVKNLFIKHSVFKEAPEMPSAGVSTSGPEVPIDKNLSSNTQSPSMDVSAP